MKRTICVSFAVATMLTGLPAAAAVIVATYDYRATFTQGPNSAIVGSVTATFDPLVRGVISVADAKFPLAGNYKTVGLLYSPTAWRSGIAVRMFVAMADGSILRQLHGLRQR